MVRRALTIVELLVVLSIIAALAALAMPALHGARERARQSVCMNNLHQIDLAMQQYMKIKREFPSMAPAGQIGGWSIELLPYLDLVDAYQSIVINDPADPQKFNKFHLPRVMQCPSRPNQRSFLNSHYALSSFGNTYSFIDIPVSMEHPWVNSLFLNIDAINNDDGPHYGGYHVGGGGQGFRLMVNGKNTDEMK